MTEPAALRPARTSIVPEPGVVVPPGAKAKAAR
jgi:hypothetical protein